MSKDDNEDKGNSFDKSKILINEIDNEYDNNSNDKEYDSEKDDEINENYEEDTLNYIEKNIKEYLEYTGIPLFEYLNIDKIDKFLDDIKL
jgi:hypothetical protein